MIEWRDGIVFCEPEFPNLLFARDGEIYDLEGRECIAIGGANSIDKYCRTANVDWWPDEQPSDEIMDRVEQKLESHNWKIDVVLSHTCPYSYMPREEFLPGTEDWVVDNSTEKWLDTIEKRLTYSKWYCGHFHTDKNDGDIQFLYEDYTELM
jgi:3-oxoacid CoA-transferase subunit A